jgi:hypothetical protein
VKFRLLLAAGVAAGLSIIPLAAAHAASTNTTGNCTTSTNPYPPQSGDTVVTNPVDGGQVYTPGPPSGATSGTADAGTQGPHGYLVAGAVGNAAPPSGTAGIYGYSTDPGLNGTINGQNTAGTTVTVCIGKANTAGVGVTAP